jgi:hypothetical protein
MSVYGVFERQAASHSMKSVWGDWFKVVVQNMVSKVVIDNISGKS